MYSIGLAEIPRCFQRFQKSLELVKLFWKNVEILGIPSFSWNMSIWGGKGRFIKGGRFTGEERAAGGPVYRVRPEGRFTQGPVHEQGPVYHKKGPV